MYDTDQIRLYKDETFIPVLGPELPRYVERAWAEGSSVALREFEQFLMNRG